MGPRRIGSKNSMVSTRNIAQCQKPIDLRVGGTEHMTLFLAL